jgi:rSAM/selenodomain-associated transferase 2
MRLSVIIPTLNEGNGIEALLSTLQSIRAQGHEVIVADGGSNDATIALANPLADQIVNSPRGRALQMNAGAAVANGDALFFLHADSRLPANFLALIRDALNRGGWGRFDIRLSADRILFRVVDWFMNRRSRSSGISTGDQGLFVTRELFDAIGGFPAIALMEDIAITKKLRKIQAPICLPDQIITSSKRWESNGAWRTIWLMWRLRYAYWRGADPAQLARIYYPPSLNG